MIWRCATGAICAITLGVLLALPRPPARSALGSDHFYQCWIRQDRGKDCWSDPVEVVFPAAPYREAAVPYYDEDEPCVLNPACREHRW